MRVLLDENGYVAAYATVGGDESWLECDLPNSFDEDIFAIIYRGYKVVDGQLVYDSSKLEEIQNEEFIEDLRLQRSKECFPIINRGTLWYERLTQEEKEELETWYLAWLDVTETLEPPEPPEWLY